MMVNNCAQCLSFRIIVVEQQRLCGGVVSSFRRHGIEIVFVSAFAAYSQAGFCRHRSQVRIALLLTFKYQNFIWKYCVD